MPAGSIANKWVEVIAINTQQTFTCSKSTIETQKR